MKQWHVHCVTGKQMYSCTFKCLRFDMSMNLCKSKSKQLYLKGMCFVAYANLEEHKYEKVKSKIQILKENTDRSHFLQQK